MKKVTFVPKEDLWNSFYQNFITICNREGDTIKALRVFGGCRTYLSDILGWNLYPGFPCYSDDTNPVINLKDKSAYFAIGFSSVEKKGEFLKNIGILHEKEKKAGVALSKPLATEDEGILVIQASKCWNSAMWKNSLYTFYLKRTIYNNQVDNQYWNALKTKEDILLKKIKPKNIEVFTSPNIAKGANGIPLGVSLHQYTGFYSICTGANKPMAELLGVA